MTDKIVLNNALGTYDVSQINNNFSKIADALNNKVLYRDNPGGTSNQVKSNIDMNGFHILNLPAPSTENEAARLKDVTNAIAGIGGYTANLINFVPQGGIKATNVQGAVEEVMRRSLVEVNVTDYGADPTGITDSSQAIRDAIAAAHTKANNLSAVNQGAKTVVVKFPPGSYLVATKVLVPMNTTLRGDGATILCNNGGSTFESGYYVGGVLTSNVGLAFADIVANVLSGVRFEGLTFYGGDVAIKMYGCVWQSGVFDCSFYNCHIAIEARLSFYATYDNITIRGDNSSFTPAHAIRLLSNTNRVLLNNISITSRNRGILLGEAGDENLSASIVFSNSSLESLQYGFEIVGTLKNFHAKDIYLEEVDNVFFDTDGALKYNVRIEDCYSYSTSYYVDLSGLRDSFIGAVRDHSPLSNVKAVTRLRQGTNGNQAVVELSNLGDASTGTNRYVLSNGVVTVGMQSKATSGLSPVYLNRNYTNNIGNSQYAQQPAIYDGGWYGEAPGTIIGSISGGLTPVNGTEPYVLTKFFFSEYTALNYSIKIIPNAGSGAGGTTPAPISLKGVVIGSHGTQIVPNGFVVYSLRNGSTGTFQLAFGEFGANNTDPAYAWMRNGQFTAEGIVKLIA